MKQLEVDARGLSCPQPVLLLKQALAGQPQTCRIIVDNPIARENVTRFGQYSGYQAIVEEKDSDFYLTFQRNG